MSFASAVKGVFSVIGDPLKEMVKGSQERKTIVAKDKGEIRKIESQTRLATANARLEMAKQGQSQDFDLDRLAMQNMKRSWKSEALMLVLFTPIIMSFYSEGGAERVNAGFVAIGAMPEWFQWCIIGIIVQTFGLRGLLKMLLEYGTNKASGMLGLVNRTQKLAKN